MALPRRVVPGQTLLITRRTLRRHFLFRPDDVMNEIYLYALAVTAQKYWIRVHAPTLLSSHGHLCVTDTLGVFPDFIRELHRLVALATKLHRKWEGAVWDHGKTSVVALVTPQAVIEKIAYTIANPVEAGLVKTASEWPGVTVGVDDIGRKTLRIRRPDIYFDAENESWPAEAELPLVMPEVLVDTYGEDDARRRLKAELERQESEATERVRDAGWKVLGAERVLRKSPFDRATSYEPLRGLEPHLAAGRGQGRARVVAIRALQAFRQAYYEALALWRAGTRRGVWPPGTWWMVVHHKARPAPA